MQLCRATWRNLTDLQRAAWRTIAANTSLPNRLGVHRNLTGQQFFIYTDFYFALLGWPLHTDPPPPQIYFWPNHILLTITAPNYIKIAPEPAYAAPGLPFFVSGSRPFTKSPLSHFPLWAGLGIFETDPSGLLYPGPQFAARFGALQSSEYIAIRAKVIATNYPHAPTHQATGIVA